MAKGDYSQGNKCACGITISNRAQRCKSCVAKHRKGRKSKNRKPTDDYSHGNKCPDCGKRITNRSTRCKLCSRKHRKQKAVRGWRKALLGNTEPSKADDLIGLCEICGQDERTPDSWWCQTCMDAIDGEYLERSLAKKLRAAA